MRFSDFKQKNLIRCADRQHPDPLNILPAKSSRDPEMATAWSRMFQQGPEG